MSRLSPKGALLTTLRRAGITVAGASLAAISLVASPVAAGHPGVLLPVASTAHAEEAYAPYDAMQPFEAEFLTLLNADRIENGLAPLEIDAGLASIARWRSDDMAARGYFSHDIGGYQVFQVLKDHGIAYRVAGENLAFNTYGNGQTVAAAERALMNSPSHRANILRPDYTHVGVGVAVAPDGRFLYTQLFKRA